MQRRPRTYVISAALAVALTGGLAGCSGSSGSEGGEDTKQGSQGSAASPAAPGKYNTLPEPCGSVSTGTLKQLLPGADSADAGSGSSEDGTSPYEGQAKATYDTDRRVGCDWKASTPAGTRHLSVDMERVVSYDPSVSDDEQAELLYDQRAGQADIPSAGTESPKQNAPSEPGSGTPSPPASPSDKGSGQDSEGDGDKPGSGAPASKGSGDTAQGGRQGATASPSAPSGSPANPSAHPSGGTPGSGASEDGDGGASPSDSPSQSGSQDEQSQGRDLSPRVLDDIGDNAYIDDRLDTAHSGVHRDITLVFRSSNVIATVRYDQWVTDKTRLPDSAELQDKARTVAQQLDAHFDEG